MPPDLNSLPPSRSPTSPSSPLAATNRSSHTDTADGLDHPPSPRLPHSPLLVSATTGIVRSPSSRPAMTHERRRSSLMTSLSLQDSAATTARETLGSPSLPPSQQRSPSMQTADPHHQRTPSLGQIHQQLENEQEAQVNRLLHMIRVQQDQLAALQASNPAATGAEAVVETPAETEPTSTATTPGGTATRRSRVTSHSRSPSAGHIQPPRSPMQRPSSPSCQSSRGIYVPSNMSSPSLRPLSSTRSQDEWSMQGTRDDSAFYQAETQMLQRENQMLKSRIRELERQLGDVHTAGDPISTSATTAP